MFNQLSLNRILISAILFFISTGVFAQINLWQHADISELNHRSNEERWTTPTEFGLFQVDVDLLKTELASAPHESQITARNSFSEFSFPMPDGSMRNFRLVEYDLVQPGLARKFPHMKAYTGIDVETGGRIHINLTKNQLWAVIREAGVSYYIDPYFRADKNYYASYDIRTYVKEDVQFECGVHSIEDGELTETASEGLDYFRPTEMKRQERGEPLTLHIYRLAVSGSFEFTSFYGGTVQGALDGIATIVNRINSVYEREAAVRMILVNNNDKIIFTDSDSDPFEDGNLGQMINVNQATIDGQVGQSNYDIGHVFGRAFYQGLAQLGSVCQNGGKARGGSVASQPVGDSYVVNIVCHEMGHQYSAPHTMYHCHNVNIPTSFEPGSGSTIMSYAGICSGAANIQNNADDYYHAHSLNQIIGFTRGSNGNCAEEIDLGNSYPDPILDYPAKLRIPVNTPFRLTGKAEDAGGDPNTLTYNWDQYQAGNRDFSNDPWNIGNPQGNEPIFRSRPPTSTPMRYFPALPIVVNNTNYLFEQLPGYERSLRFRFIVRDNTLENGGTAWVEQNIDVIDNSAAGLFRVSNFNQKDTITSGDYVELTWDVADTDLPPLRTEFVNIYLSTDGGNSFPFLIKGGAKNDGHTMVNIPNVQAEKFRFMVEAANSVYFDVNNTSGVIVGEDKPSVGFRYDDRCYQLCAPDVEIVDIETFALGGFDGEVNFTFTGDIPDGAKVKFEKTSIQVNETAKMIIDLRDAVDFGAYDLSFLITGDGIDTLERSIETVIVTNNFDALTLDEPFNGSTGVEFVPTLKWSGVADADEYTVQVSSDPQFNDIVFTVEGTDLNEIPMNVQLDAGGVYFWRVMPINACGQQNVNRISSFQVKALTCEEFCSTEPEKILSSSGTPTVDMTINTGASITVNDLNVTQIKGRHSDMGHVVLTLEGPSGTQVEMYSAGTCEFWNTQIDMGFDDDAALQFPNCVDNASQGLRFVPRNPLSALNGSTGTTYKLIMQDVMSGAGGALESWCFEICGDLIPEHPFLVKLDTVRLQNLETRTITNDKLEIAHNNFGPSEITITLVDVPDHGRMLFNGAPVLAGHQLSMQDILDGKLAYQNLSVLYDRDHFSVVATAPGGGYLGTPRVDFLIGLSSSNNTLPENNSLVIYPNPANQQIYAKINGSEYIDQITIYDLQGRMLKNVSVPFLSQTAIPINDISAGIYLIKIQSGQFTETRKFVKQ